MIQEDLFTWVGGTERVLIWTSTVQRSVGIRSLQAGPKEAIDVALASAQVLTTVMEHCVRPVGSGASHSQELLCLKAFFVQLDHVQSLYDFAVSHDSTDRWLAFTRLYGA